MGEKKVQKKGKQEMDLSIHQAGEKKHLKTHIAAMKRLACLPPSLMDDVS